MPVLETITLGYKAAKFGYKVGERLAIRESNRDIANWVSRFDYGAPR